MCSIKLLLINKMCSIVNKMIRFSILRDSLKLIESSKNACLLFFETNANNQFKPLNSIFIGLV